MPHLSLTSEVSESLAKKLILKGYTANERKQYISFNKGLADKTYIHYSNNIIRARKNTEGENIMIQNFGKPNGKASDSQNDVFSTWFFNGYSGKKGSAI